MKRFALNKIKIAKLVRIQEIKGGKATPNSASADLQACVTDECVTENGMSCAEMVCTNTSIDGQDVTDPAPLP
ncbi:hypothetical protein H2O64_05625 [Kordia sp. YSTF-M3]|uniref:DUF4762 domain-containing protein n=1 Tax=Kordia aestuariivivens TaxID=2759037 RepID=A0ABR7Q6E0_9FLAO|nr:hypothetical protein [Kordia aestuariivivens]MBC8754141.1 hypothetical protein [Kordia aestuariivivens]